MIVSSSEHRGGSTPSNTAANSYSDGTRDRDRGLQRTGYTYRAVSFMSPFSGYKRSGLGCESGKDAIYEYLH